MRATASPGDTNHVKLVVEVDEDEMSDAIDRTAKTLARQVSVKGFRKGKVPKSVLIAHIGGADVLRGEAIRESIPDFYARAVTEAAIDPISEPAVTVTAGEDQGMLVFEAEVEVRPEVEISGQRHLRVTLPSPQVTDAEVDAQIDQFRETDATLHDVERPIVTGDLVTMDVTVTEVAADDPFEMSDFMYTVGSGAIVKGVDELIIGLRAGENLTVTGPGRSGDDATYLLRLKQVKERVLPALTDEWVAESTEWSTADEMRDALLDQMRRRKVVEARLAQRDAVLVALGELVPEDVAPESLVASETNERLHNLGQRLAEQKLDLETFLQITNQSADALLESMRSDAARAVRIDLALRALVRAEGLEPSETEVADEIQRTAAAMGVGADELRANLSDSGRTIAFVAEVAKMKASRWLIENVTFVDPAGLEIDRALLRDDESADADA